MPSGYTDDAVLRSAHTSSNFLASTLRLFVSFMVGAGHAGLAAVQYFRIGKLPPCSEYK